MATLLLLVNHNCDIRNGIFFSRIFSHTFLVLQLLREMTSFNLTELLLKVALK